MTNSVFDGNPLKKQNELIAARLKSFDSMRLLLTNLPNYPFTNMAPEILQKIEQHASNALKCD
ncbi:MAG: hypothetical protein V4717_11160 [Bacteroidota bacterium]